MKTKSHQNTGIMKKTILPATALALIGSAASVQALPDAFASVQTQTQSGTYGGAPGQYDYGQPNSLPSTLSVSSSSGLRTSATATLSMGPANAPDPTLRAVDNYSAGNGGYYGFTEATAELVYGIQLNGPVGTSATLDFSLNANTYGGFGPANAICGGYVDILYGTLNSINPNTGAPSFSGNYTQIFSFGTFGQLTSASSTPIGGGGSDNLSYRVPVGATFLLALSVDAASDPTQYWYPGGFPPAGDCGAVIDPTLVVDPSTANASSYSLTYSAGIEPVPEPSTWTLLGVGLAALLAFCPGRKVVLQS